MNSVIKKINCPGRFFEVLGYINVGIGTLILVLILIVFPNTCSHAPTIGASPSTGVGILLIALVGTIIGSQICFAISKVVKAAEKYLENKGPKGV